MCECKCIHRIDCECIECMTRQAFYARYAPPDWAPAIGLLFVLVVGLLWKLFG